MKVTLTSIRRAAVTAVAVLALASMAGRPRRPVRRIRRQPAGLPPLPPPVLPQVMTQDLLDGLKHPSRWLTYYGDYTGRRHSPLTQITVERTSIGSRRSGRFRPRTWCSAAAASRRRWCTTASSSSRATGNVAWAIDSRTGRPIWRYRRQFRRASPTVGNSSIAASRR